jgi:hypothetical protein
MANKELMIAICQENYRIHHIRLKIKYKEIEGLELTPLCFKL